MNVIMTAPRLAAEAVAVIEAALNEAAETADLLCRR